MERRRSERRAVPAGGHAQGAAIEPAKSGRSRRVFQYRQWTTAASVSTAQARTTGALPDKCLVTAKNDAVRNIGVARAAIIQ